MILNTFLGSRPGCYVYNHYMLLYPVKIEHLLSFLVSKHFQRRNFSIYLPTCEEKTPRDLNSCVQIQLTAVILYDMTAVTWYDMTAVMLYDMTAVML